MSAQRKPRSSSPLVHQVQLLFGTLAVLGISLCIAWFFIIPSVVLGSIQNKIILYTSDNLDGSNNSILLAYFGEKKEDHELFVFDSTEQAEVPNGYGSYAVGVVPSLLLLDAEHTDESVRSIMSRVFGVPIDEVVASESLATVRSPYETARTFWREPQQLLAALRVSYLAGQSDIATVHSYHETAALLGGGALVLTSEEKRCSVAVINTTTTRRLAENTSKLLERNNVYVVREDSSTPEEPVTHIQEATRPREECQTLVKKITPFFPVTTQVETQNSETQRFRADIVILLGTDTITAHGAEEQE